MRTHARDALERSHSAHEELADAQLHLAADLQRRAQEAVERVVDGALGRVLYRHDAKIRIRSLHLVEHLIDRGKRQRAHRVAEVRQHRRLRECALRPEEGHLERLLLRKTRRHDFPKEAQHLLIPQRPLIALAGHAQNLRLTLRHVEVRRMTGARLRRPDHLRKLGPFIDERVNLFIDRIDARACRRQIRRPAECASPG